MYEKGTKFYTLKNSHSCEIIEWTFITVDKGTGFYLMKDQNGQYRNLTKLDGFCEDPNICQIDVFKGKLRDFRGEKRSIIKNIERYKREVQRYQKIIEEEKLKLIHTDKKIDGVSKHYEYLQETYPEEFL